jgi:ABC-type dipeptide/oligopeptide/nickel transport system ATPase component
MLKSLKIENFRGFESFELKQLGRINLLVGENNSGKTSVLEALLLFLSRMDLRLISRSMIARNEVFASPQGETELDICHLFSGHELGRFRIYGRHELSEEQMIWAVCEVVSDEKSDDLNGLELDLEYISKLDNQESPEISHHAYALSPDGGLRLALPRRANKESNTQAVKMQFIPTESVSSYDLFKLFEDVVLRPEEKIVYQALQTIEPRCERLYGKVTANRFEVKLLGLEHPIPLGSMGDGMSRILRLALGIANAKGGVLVVDEIDRGLHFTTMTKMWKMLWEASKQLDVQIFATTHSRDCWESLAEVAESEGIQADEIMVHRIEKGKPSSVMFDSEQMAIAVEERLEVR